MEFEVSSEPTFRVMVRRGVNSARADSWYPDVELSPRLEAKFAVRRGNPAESDS